MNYSQYALISNKVQGLGFRVWGLGFEVWGLGSRFWGMGFNGLRFRTFGV